ncbi:MULTISPECIES: hypothetical protein [Gilliamella]|uniref:hypothetical protein n=1 Tax=Gilliamella TaxID=1193503 RepID=UPI00080DF4BD|nr:MULTISPECIES: hypothetical protein [Gilliamella]OCG62000.1 hypothetical protein A9G37_11455 [Gilliamella apicola]OCG77023.1 hypothetical protein A9G44_05805 [Gilliamella apicola]
MKFLKYIVGALLLSLLIGCSGKFQEPQNITTPVTGLSKDQVKKAILASATNGRAAFGTWKMDVIDSNTIRGRLFNRKFEVVVNIPYSAKSYSINYVSVSNNLKNSQGGVHRNYNRWINNLDAKIQENIFKAK